MKKGEKALLTCRSDYAYGKAGSPPKIPADATLNFEASLRARSACMCRLEEQGKHACGRPESVGVCCCCMTGAGRRCRLRCLLQVELLSWKSTKDITDDGGVTKATLEEGRDWKKPSGQDEVLGGCRTLMHPG